MFQFQVVQANFGDCLILHYGTIAAPRFLLIDGGPTHIYQDHLRSRVEGISTNGGKLDRVVVSHVDSDHIGGLLELFGELLESQAAGDGPIVEVDGLWHNSFEKAIGGGTDIAIRLQAAIAGASASVMSAGVLSVKGIANGHKLRTLSTQLDIARNEGFANDLICVDDAPDAQEFGNLNLQVVGPTQANLDELQTEWLEWLDKFEPAIATGQPQLMANADQSIPNLSSIMFMAKADDKTILLTGDGRSDHLLDGLEAAGQLDNNGKLHVDVFKVPHHGSNRNATKTFFKKVTADTYVISANGHPDNPDLSTLIWIVEAGEQQGRHPHLIFTNRTFAVDKLAEEYPEDEFGYTTEILPEDQSDLIIDLA